MTEYNCCVCGCTDMMVYVMMVHLLSV